MKIKSVKVFRKEIILRSASAQELEEVTKIYSEIHYNQEGKKIKDLKYDSFERIEYLIVFQYDDTGKLIEEITFEDEETFVERKTFEYDDKSNLSKEFLHYMDGSFDTVEYFYNHSGQLVEKKQYDSDYELEEFTTYKYDGVNLINKKVTDAEGNVLKETSYAFNENGDLIEDYEIEENSGFEFKRVIEFNDKGVKTATYIYNEGDLTVEKYCYDENDPDKVVKIIEENSNGKNTIELEYDNNGNVTLQRIYDINGLLVREIIMTYDANNNLLEYKIISHKVKHGGALNYCMVYEYEFYN